MSITLMTMLTVAVVAVPLEQPKDVAQVLTTAKRLSAASGVPAGQETTLPPLRARLDALIIFVEKYSQRELEELRPAEVVNLLQGIRDIVDAGSQVSILPEERLTWIKVGLDLTRVINRSLADRAGKLPATTQTRFDSQIDLLRRQYRETRDKCLTD